MDSHYYIFVTPFFPSPDNWRGAYCLDFVKALERCLGYGEREEWKVLVFKPGSGADYEIGGVKVYRFPTRQLPSNVLPFLFRRYNTRSFLGKLKEVLSTVHLHLSTSPSLICHANTALLAIYPLALKKIAPSCKTLLHHHDLQSFGLNGGILSHCWLYNLIGFPILRRMHEQIDCHVFISEASRNSFLAAPNTDWTDYMPYKKQMRGLPYRPVRIKRSVILHNGVDTAVFNPTTQPRPQTSIFTIGCVGNFDTLKEQMTLLKAVDVLTQGRRVTEKIKVVFVGSGEKLDDCRSFAEANEIDAEFRTEVRHEALAAFYRGLDLFVLPSVFEGFGCVYTEAWASGVTFIACKGQGIEDVVNVSDRDVWLAKLHDEADLADKIEHFIKERPEQRLVGRVTLEETVVGFLEDLKKCDW